MRIFHMYSQCVCTQAKSGTNPVVDILPEAYYNGKAGCGKSTLIRQMESILAPNGARNGKNLYEIDLRHQAS